MLRRRVRIGLELSMGAMAVVCGLILASGQADRVLGMQQSVLVGTPFSNFMLPGLILAVAVGGSQLLAAWTELRDERWAGLAALGAGVVLMGWIIGEVLLLGWIIGEVLLLGWIAPRGLQPFCFAYGALQLALTQRPLSALVGVTPL
jgi:hypothetical protein